MWIGGQEIYIYLILPIDNSHFFPRLALKDFSLLIQFFNAELHLNCRITVTYWEHLALWLPLLYIYDNPMTRISPWLFFIRPWTPPSILPLESVQQWWKTHKWSMSGMTTLSWCFTELWSLKNHQPISGFPCLLMNMECSSWKTLKVHLVQFFILQRQKLHCLLAIIW